MKRIFVLFAVILLVVTCLPLSALAAGLLDKDANPPDVVSSGSFEATSGTRMDFSVSGGLLMASNWSYGRHYAIYTLMGTCKEGENLSLSVAGTQAPGVDDVLVWNILVAKLTFRDSNANIIGETLEYNSGAAKSSPLSHEISATVPPGTKTVDISGTFNCRWAGATVVDELAAVMVKLDVVKTEPTATPVPVATPVLPTTETPKPGKTIALVGLALSAEAKPMPWMKVDAKVFYGEDAYDESKRPDAVVSGITDHKGRLVLHIPVPEDSEGPVGILLTGTLTCVWPYDGGEEVFYFVDMQDKKSKENECIRIGAWLTVDPDDYPDATEDNPIVLYRLLSFYEREDDAWSIDLDTGTADTLVPCSSDPESSKRSRDYSTLYTAAFDAWFFGAAVLGEEDALTDNKLRIEVRWPSASETEESEDTEKKEPVSHFDRDYTVCLTSGDSRRDDESRFTILHEMGHAFDFVTNSGAMRTDAGMAADDTNHGGYLNETSADSYKEGFATFYAGSVQLYSGYDNPEILSWINLGTPAQYKAWGANGKYEELAIASLLYQSHFLINKVAVYWSLLDPPQNNFYEYYQTLKAYLDEKNPQGAQTLEDWAYDSGLYKMPFGNNAYDLGEPYQDNNDNEKYDAGELFGDLMFAVDKSGLINNKEPLHEIDRSKLVIGQTSDAQRNRDAAQASQTIEPPKNSYIVLDGEPVEYVLLDILPDGEEGTRVLMSAADGKVLVGLGGGQTGKVVVSIPGGGTIFEGDLTELQQRFSDTVGQTVPLAEATVSAEDLAPEGTQVAATYGSTEASGVFTAPKLSPQELMRLADEYDGSASIDQVTAELSGRASADFAEQKDGDSDAATNFELKKQGGRLIYIIIGIVLALGAGTLVLVVVLLYVRGRKRSSIPSVAPYAGPQYCSRCGNIVPTGSAFCTMCGAPQPAAAPAPGQYGQPPKKSPALLIIGIAAAVLMLGGSIYLLFFAGQPAVQQSSAAVTPELTAMAGYADTRDAADLVGVWEGKLEYTGISGDWGTFGYPVSKGYSQPFMLKIREGSPELNWREAILSIDGGDAAVLSAGFEGRFLEIRGEWQSCDVSISVKYDETRGGFAGTGEYIGSDKHAAFDFFMAPADGSAGDNTESTDAVPDLDEAIGGTWSLYAGYDQSGELSHASSDAEFSFTFDANNGFSGAYKYGEGYVDSTFSGTYDVTDSMAVSKNPYDWYYYATIEKDSIVDLGEATLLSRLGEYGPHLIFKFREMDGERLLYEENQRLYFKKSTTPSDESVNPQAVASASSQPSSAQKAATVSNKTITVSMDYDSGEGVYTGEVNGDGAPHGQGRFTMQKSDNKKNWSYKGQWASGKITGEGVMTQDDFVFTGSFKSGLMDGYCEITDSGILRYKGMCKGGKLHGQGTLYTSSGKLLFEGEFKNDMPVESVAARQARGAAFKPECENMDEQLYDGCMAEDNTFGYPVAVWGFPLAMGEQASSGTIVIGHMGEDSYPVCLVYRYGVDEPKMTSDDWINAWGVVTGLYEYVDSDGLTVTCPMVEVVCWDNSMENYEE